MTESGSPGATFSCADARSRSSVAKVRFTGARPKAPNLEARGPGTKHEAHFSAPTPLRIMVNVLNRSALISLEILVLSHYGVVVLTEGVELAEGRAGAGADVIGLPGFVELLRTLS